MKKVKSVVWRFFERIEEENRCVAVMCKLCDNQYKYFGNTTNLRVHLINKHPVQWELSENGTLDETSLQEAVEAAEHEPKLRKNKYGPKSKKEEVWNDRNDKNVGFSVKIDRNNKSSTNEALPSIEIQRVPVFFNRYCNMYLQNTYYFVFLSHGILIFFNYLYLSVRLIRKCLR